MSETTGPGKDTTDRLFTEAQETGKRITGHLLAGDRSLTIGATVAAALVTLAYKEQLYYVLMPGPLVFALLGVFSLN
jgi:predicted transporter